MLLLLLLLLLLLSLSLLLFLMLGQEIMQPLRWPLFCHRQANTVEQSAWTASATGHHLWSV